MPRLALAFGAAARFLAAGFAFFAARFAVDGTIIWWSGIT